MTIALDATPLTVPTGGVRRYTWELANALAREFREDRYWLISDQPIPDLGEMPANLRRGQGPTTRLERKWWLSGVQREMSRRGCDVFHGTDFSVPYLRRYPSVMTLHDLSPWKPERWQPDAARVRRRTPFLLRFAIATLVITPSEAVRREAIQRFRLDPSCVVAIPLAASASFRPVRGRQWDRPYLLFVGTLEPRKNIARLIEAWRAVRKKHEVDLILAGRVRSDFKPPAPEQGLYLVGAVPEQDLAAWYCGAVACVYPSLYEGFGLPVLEAMQCGSVVITSRDAAIMEVAGGAAIHVDAEDTKALAAAMTEVAADKSKFDGLRERALARAGEFTWTRTAQRTREVYRVARERFNARAQSSRSA
ncbi:MAG: glycosyltransferase family 4 protein [Bryobacterales bacterium]|nr:glycosyltransferase family 4 protein [Bryobacterales bacterium]